MAVIAYGVRTGRTVVEEDIRPVVLYLGNVVDACRIGACIGITYGFAPKVGHAGNWIDGLVDVV